MQEITTTLALVGRRYPIALEASNRHTPAKYTLFDRHPHSLARYPLIRTCDELSVLVLEGSYVECHRCLTDLLSL
jgi:hypothetical protein